MATVQDTGATATANSVLAGMQAASKSGVKKDEGAASADRFLTMLVAQLKNQDPLNPLDNAQVTSQMAQISTVEGINKLNETMSTLSLGMRSSESLDAAAMVGRRVLADGNALVLADGVATGGYSLASGAENLTLTVKSASGVVVYQGELGAQAAGMHMFQWDGVADNGQAAVAGTYSFEITARSGKESVAAQTLTMGRVDGVSPSASGTKLTVGGLGEVPIASVKHIL
jgi:flagellar basal-body rod modification protein FlgD